MKKPASVPWILSPLRINGKVLLLSLISASSFWFLNALSKRYTTTLQLPLRLEYASEGLMTVKPAPKQVRLSLTGVGWDLLRRKNWLQQSTPLLLSLPNPTNTKVFSKAALSTTFSDQLRSFRLNYVADSVSIDIQERISKTVALSIDSLKIPLAKNCRIYTPITLGTVYFTLTGAKRYVEAYPDIHRLQFDSMEHIDERFEKAMLAISLPHEAFLQAHPSEVEISFSVGHYEQKEILVPIERLHFPKRSPYRALLSDTALRISYTVRSDQVQAVKPELFTIIADYKQRNRRARTLRPQILLAPAEALDIRIHPSELDLRYERRR